MKERVRKPPHWKRLLRYYLASLGCLFVAELLHWILHLSRYGFSAWEGSWAFVSVVIGVPVLAASPLWLGLQDRFGVGTVVFGVAFCGYEIVNALTRIPQSTGLMPVAHIFVALAAAVAGFSATRWVWLAWRFYGLPLRLPGATGTGSRWTTDQCQGRLDGGPVRAPPQLRDAGPKLECRFLSEATV
jgi:hypothetical protein